MKTVHQVNFCSVCDFSAEVATDIFCIRFHSENLQRLWSIEEYCTYKLWALYDIFSNRQKLIIQYTLPQILHTYFKIKVCHLIDSQTLAIIDLLMLPSKLQLGDRFRRMGKRRLARTR